jgi:hypothetical protein
MDEWLGGNGSLFLLGMYVRGGREAKFVVRSGKFAYRVLFLADFARSVIAISCRIPYLELFVSD